VTAKAKIEWDFRGVRMAVAQERSVLVWEQPSRRALVEGEYLQTPEVGSEWLRLDEDEARAIYEALADYFGHAGHDTRALRKDYDAERRRVDHLIEAVINR
jgi:hypothetical protein